VSLMVRTARAEDVVDIVELVQSAYRGEASRLGWTTEADLLHGQRTDSAEVGDLIRADGSVLLLMADELGLLACCQVERRGDTAYFGMFAVRPGAQGVGTGRGLLDEAGQWAVRHWGSLRLELTVLRQRPELLAWYARRGCVATGEVRAFPYGEERFGVPQREDLELLVLVRSLPGG
jgi:GNAT superfamily N-acetyltransferase